MGAQDRTKESHVTANPADHEQYVIGVDFGTLSGRALVVRVSDGEELGSAVHEYGHGVMDTAHRLRVNGGGRSHPTGRCRTPRLPRRAAHAVPAAVADAGVDPADVIGIATDFTASTPLPVLADGTPLCELPEFRDRPHAYVKLWKHHAAQPQADRINAVAHDAASRGSRGTAGSSPASGSTPRRCSCSRRTPRSTSGWTTGSRRPIGSSGSCAASTSATPAPPGTRASGRTAPTRAATSRRRSTPTSSASRVEARPPDRALGDRAGGLTAQAAAWTGLPEGIAVAVGNVDAHVTAPAARAVEAGQMLAIMGTSTCHVMNHDRLVEVPGMCGVVDGGIVAGSYGYEAGQSGVGDIFAWYVENQVPGRYFDEAEAAGCRSTSTSPISPSPSPGRPRPRRARLGQRQPLGARRRLALRAAPRPTLATRAEQGYRALLEATAFGARMIVETFGVSGVPVASSSSPVAC